MLKSRPKIIVILGPTATGKTKLAVKLASEFRGEIISADSRQVYRGMDVGTGKDLADYCLQDTRYKKQDTNKNKKSKIKNQKFTTIKIPYHLIDIASPKTNFNVAKWVGLAKKAIEDIVSRGKTPFIVGGTGLYISALVEGYNLADTKPNFMLRKKLENETLTSLLQQLKKLDPIMYEKIDKKNKRRVVRAVELAGFLKTQLTYAVSLQGRVKPNYDFLILGVKKPREEINKLIDERVEARLKQGMIEEVERLHREGVSWKRLLSFGLEYKWISKYLQGEIEREEMILKLKTASHQFAKRQMTWFGKMAGIKWVDNYNEAKSLIDGWLKD